MTPQSEQRQLVAHTSLDKLFCLLLIAGSLIYYWAVFFYHALDAGQADDFVDGLWFFEIFSQQQHWLDKLAVIALPNHEHVTIFNHLVYLADYALFGQINFFHYMLVGHCIVLACCVLLAEWLQKSIGWWYALALVFGLFLNLFYWHASFWAITALSNQAVILFALLTARSFSRSPDTIAMPLLWALLAVTTQFNGLLVLPALIAASFFTAVFLRCKQDWQQLLIWAGAFIVVTAAYIGYENPFAADHLWRYVNYTDPGNLADYTHRSSGQPAVTAQSFLGGPLALLSVMGATVFNLKHWLPAAISGALLVLVLFYLLLRQGRNLVDRFWWTVLFFVIASLILVAIGRGFVFGPEAGLLYRYRLYSFLLLLLLIGGLLQRHAPVFMPRLILLVCVIVQVSSWHVLDDIKSEREAVKVSHYYWLIDGGMGRSQMPFYPHNQDLRLFNAYEHGYYNPYEAIDSRHKPVSVVAVNDDEACASEATVDSDASAVRVWSKKSRALAAEITLDVLPPANPVQLLLCSHTAAYLLTLDTHNINQNAGKYWPLLVLKKQLPPSQYRVLLRERGASDKWLGNVSFP